MKRVVKFLCFLSVLGTSFVLGMFFFIFGTKCVDLSALERYEPGLPTVVLDNEGNEWARFSLDRREPITIDRMPQHLIHAFMAAEDRAFFSHNGISVKGIIRSLLVNLYHGASVQGASTITQQLVRLLFFDAKKTFKRKIKEQFYSLLVERQFTKQQILQTYLNHVYFGAGIYGVQAAAQRFWDKDVEQLSIDEAATLAAIVKSPSQYCPLRSPLSAQRRRNIVLGCMARMNYISADACAAAQDIPVTTVARDTQACAPHVQEMLRIFLEDLIGKTKLYTGGYKVQTTLNKKIQYAAQESFAKQVDAMRGKLPQDIDGALITLDVKTGGIRALVGGYDFNTSKFNRAVQAKRQMGSVFKPIVYAAAMQAGHTFDRVEVDEPLTIESAGSIWQPSNASNTFNGPMTLARALSYSNNIITIKTLLDVGVDAVYKLAEKFRLSGMQPYPSLALGCLDTTVQDVAAMFNVFAHHGVYVKPYLISWVKDQLGKKVYRHKPESERVLAPRDSDQVAKVLGIMVDRHRKKYKNWILSEAIGKTGTTNDSRTCWFAGSTPELTTAMYMGCDDNRSLGKNIYAMHTVIPVWVGLHQKIVPEQKEFVWEPSLQERSINLWTGASSTNIHAPNVATILV